MLEPSTPQQNFSTADLQSQLDTLKQENIRLRSQLQACERSQLKLQSDNGSALEHRLLEATANATNALLTITPFDEAVNTALQIIGETLETDRVDIIENLTHPTDSSLWWRMLYEWNSLGTMSQLAHPGASQGTYEGIEEWGEQLSQGQTISSLLEDMPEPFRSGQAELGVKALHIVPIFVEKKWWGVVGFDDCHEVKRRTPAELTVLKIAADCIGSAIQRERTQQALLEAEQARSQELERINTELQQALDRLTESEKRYRTLFELSNEGIYRFEINPPVSTSLLIDEQVDLIYQNYRYAEVNNAFVSMLGLESATDAINKSFADFFKDLKTNREGVRAAVINGYQIRNAEAQEINANGQRRYILWNTVSEIRDGYVCGGWGTQTDITELREAQQALLQAEQERSQELERINTELQQTLDRLAESEERYRTLFELSNEGIYRFEFKQPVSTLLPVEEQLDLVSQRYCFVEANQTFCAQMGLSIDQLREFTLSDFHGDLEANRQVNRSIITNEYRIRNAETEELDASGRRRHFLNNVVCDVKDGYVWGGWCTQTDITELRETQQALLQAEQDRVAELEKLNEELQQREYEVQRSYRLLSTVAAISRNLLESPEVDSAIVQAFQRMGEAAAISRITLLQEKLEADSGRLQHHAIQEWTASSVPRQMDDPATQIMYNDEYSVLIDDLHAGRSIWYTLEALSEPARTQQAGIEVKSTGAVPIFIEGAYFGCVAFDDCVDYREWSTQEIDVLSSGAGAIGAALHRKQLVDRLISERIQAEQERAAELAKANEALKRSLDILAADPDLDRFIGHTLKVIADQFDAPLAEHWSHAKQTNMTHLTLSCWQGQILRPIDQPEHPGLIGVPIPPELRHNETLERRQRHILYRGIGSETDEIGEQISAQVGVDVSAWYTSRGVTQFLNIPLNVGDTTIGALAIYLPSDRSFPEQTIELAHAFAQQLALAIQLTQLAEEAKQAAILEERNRMARDIHDTLAQSFTGIIMQLEAVSGDISITPDGMQTRLDRISNLARLGLAEARRSVQALRPQALEAANFADALRYLLHQMTHDTPICATLNVEGTPYPLPDTIEENLLRIAQEALTNAIRHGQAHTIALQLLFEGAAVHLQIRDDGNGFDPHRITPTGFGLAGMQERTRHLNGHLHLISQPEQGTEITITVPVER